MPDALTISELFDDFSTPVADQSVPLAVTRISVSAYRNYDAFRLNLDARPVILTGANGSGKTNLMEAISMLVPGRGMRRASLGDLQNHKVPTPWAVAADVQTPSGSLHIGTGRDPDDSDGDRRLVHIDGKAVRGQAALADHIALACITPDMDRILAEGPSARRKFLDRLVYSFDPAHSGRVQRYEKAMRERLRLLRDGVTDPRWLRGLEDDMAQTSVAIAAARRQLIQQLQDAIQETNSAFPRADLALAGFAEEALDTIPALLVEDGLREAYAAERQQDAQSGTTTTGPHRSDLIVHHRAKACPVDLCSTGEQKALLIATMLGYMRVLTRHRGLIPFFLLDDIAAHLDDSRRMALFEEILTIGAQAWLSGTDQGPFAGLQPYAQSFLVDQGVIAQI